MDDNRFDYQKLTSALAQFSTTKSAGESTLGRNLYYFSLGSGAKKIFLNGAHHALEWITAPLLVAFGEAFAAAQKGQKTLFGYDVPKIAEQVTYYIMPMVNPDGVEIVLNGVETADGYTELIQNELAGRPAQTVWQANVRGVDLNHNYDALFYEEKRLAEAAGITGPGPTRWPGDAPFSEAETRAVRAFVLQKEFDAAVAFHSQGEVIYWSFAGKGFPLIAEELAKASGYALDNAEGFSSYSGFKDWYLDKFNLPAFTVEVGQGVNPLPFSVFQSLQEPNFRLILELGLLIAE